MDKVRYRELASGNLYKNAEYIARDKPEAAYRWIDTIEGVCETLARNPEMGQARKSKNRRNVPVIRRRPTLRPCADAASPDESPIFAR